jgi:hypothetical protein
MAERRVEWKVAHSAAWWVDWTAAAKVWKRAAHSAAM